jgi:hypothetical protein
MNTLIMKGIVCVDYDLSLNELIQLKFGSLSTQEKQWKLVASIFDKQTKGMVVVVNTLNSDKFIFLT